MVGEPAVGWVPPPHCCWAIVANEALIESNAFIKADGDMVSCSFFFFLTFSIAEESSEEETERFCLDFLTEAMLTRENFESVIGIPEQRSVNEVDCDSLIPSPWSVRPTGGGPERPEREDWAGERFNSEFTCLG